VLGWTMLNELQSGSGWDQLATWPLSPLPLPRKALNESADRWRLQNSPIINVKASIRPERERQRHEKCIYLWLSAIRATWMTTSFTMGPCRKQTEKMYWKTLGLYGEDLKARAQSVKSIVCEFRSEWP